MGFTGTHSLPFPDRGSTVLPQSRDFINLAAAVDAALTIAADGARWNRGVIPSGAAIDALDEGIHQVTSYARASSLTHPSGKLPVLSAGVLEVIPVFANRVVRWTSTGSAGRQVWQTEKDSGTWTPWHRLDRDPASILSTTRIMSGDLSTYLTAGYYSVWGTGDAAKIKGWPFAGSGIMQVLTFGNVTQQLVMTRAGIALRALVNGVPFEWDYLSGGESESSAGSGGSGWKRVPLAVTLGQPDADAPTSGQYRVPLRWDAPIVRWRLHVANRQPKTGASRGSVDLGGVWAGARGVDGAWSGTPTQISGAVSLPSDGSEWVSEWRDEPLDGDRMLAFTYTAPAAPWSLCGGGWSVTGPIDGTATALTTVQSVPLSWWIEAETYATTPVVAVIGDSLSCGVGATTPVLDSVLSQWCRAHGALPVHWAASGDHMLGMADGSAWKWTRWDGLARPDAVLWAVGSNDLASADLATMRARFSSVLPIVRERTDGPIFLATISPRDGETGTWETTRRAYNTWLRSRPAGARAVFEFAAAVSPDDETLIPALTSDGIHLTTAGYAAQVAAIASPLTSPAPVYA